MAAVHGAQLGLKLTPQERPRFEGLPEERLFKFEEIQGEVPSGPAKDASVQLLQEVRRLTGRQRRVEKDPAAVEAQQRREEGERRLRAIAATAKEYLADRSPSAEKRLRELLEMEGQE